MWLVCQIGAREHYAIACALHSMGELGLMVSDFWVPSKHIFNHLPGTKRLCDRNHPDLAAASVVAPNLSMLAFELRQRLMKRRGWSVNVERNALFQQKAICNLSQISNQGPEVTLFSYSYAARDLFRYAKRRGWRTVLGQIDPGPEEERIVSAEHKRYPELGSRWQPAPSSYWDSWREELNLADVVVVNSEWSRQCLVKEGVSSDKIEIIPLVYERSEKNTSTNPALKEQLSDNDSNDQGKVTKPSCQELDQKAGALQEDVCNGQPYQVLFLGQLNLRKGIGRLLDAMRLLKDEPVKLTLAGPSEIDATAWADLPNVEWLGSVPRSEVGRLYENSDIFILPTLSDGYAITQLEALAHGLPVIASKHCGEAVEHGVNGVILHDLEPATIAQAILEAQTANFEFPQPGKCCGIDQLGNRLLAIAEGAH